MRHATTLLLALGVSACAAAPLPAPEPVSPTILPFTVVKGPLNVGEPSAEATTSSLGSSSPAAGPADPPPIEVEYPFKGVTKIADDCQEASVVLTTAPKKMGWDYDWTWTRQALFANPQFQIVEGPAKPAAPMQIRLDMYAIPEGFALVAVCHDGATCNKLAAMYRSTVQTCDPQLECGALPIEGVARRPALVPASGQWLPVEEGNVVGRCARIGICLRVKNEPIHGNPSVACQSAPTKFKTECARKATCDEVVSCLR
jgi:hypothetical protein